jgi:hypothetical protein
MNLMHRGTSVGRGINARLLFKTPSPEQQDFGVSKTKCRKKQTVFVRDDRLRGSLTVQGASVAFRLLVSNGVTVATDTGVLISLTVALAGGLALEHLRVLRDTVAFTLRNLVFGGLGLVASGSPGEVITADLDVVVGEFTELVVIHTQKLGLFGSAKVESGDLVDDPGDGGTDDERVGGDGGDVGDLHVELLPVVLDPSTRNTVVDTIETDNVRGSKDAVEEETDHTSNTVLSEHIHSIINTNPELDFGCKVAHDTSSDSENNRCPRSDETRSGSGSDKTRDGTGTPTDHGPLTGKSPIEDDPSDGSEHGSQVGVPAGHGSTKVGTEGGTTVEAQPTEPQEDGTEGDERDVVRTEVEHHLFLASSENHRVGKSRHTRTDFDGTASCVIEDTPLEGPSVGTPNPASDRAVDESSPEEDEDHAGNQATTLSDGTNDNGSSNSTELHLY